MHRTRSRPTYKLAYKTVTELEWRCCPGHQGPDCKDVKVSPNRRTVTGGQLYPVPNPGQPRHTQRAERRETGQHETRYGADPDKLRLLESEVQRLSRTMLDLQGAVAGLTAGLRADLQEDAGKMLVTLLNNMRPPDADGAGAGGAEEGGANGGSAVHLDGHQATRGGPAGDRGLEKVMARLDDMNDALKSRDEALEELRGTVTGQEGQIRLLMDASQSQAPPAQDVGADGGPAPSDIDVLQTYIDNKLEKLRKELDQGVEERMIKLQSSCDDRIQSAQKACEEVREKGLVSLTKLVDTREADLRKEIRELRLDMTLSDGPIRTQRQTDPANPEAVRDDLKDLWREVERVAEAHRVLNARMDNELAHLLEPRSDDEYGPLLEELEARINVTEQNAEVHCFYVEEKLSKELADEAADLRRLLDERLNGMEDQFTNMLVEISNSSFPGMFGDAMDAVQAEVNNGKFLLQGLDEKVNAVGEMCSSGCPGGPSSAGSAAAGEDLAKDVWFVKNDLEELRANVAGNSDKLRVIEDAVDRQALEHQRDAKTVDDLQGGFVAFQDNVGSLAGAVAGLVDDVGKHSQDVQRLNATCCQSGRMSVSSPVGVGGASEGTPTDDRLDELKDRLDAFAAELVKSKEAVSEGISAVDGRVSKLEKVCGSLNAVSDNVRGVREGLERHVAGLWERLRGVNRTLGVQSGDISRLQGALRSVQTQMAGLARHVVKDGAARETGPGVRPQRPAVAPDGSRTAPIQVQVHPRVHRVPQIHIPLVIPALRPLPATPRPALRQPPPVPRRPGAPPASLPMQRPVVETGEAGPPGFMRRVTVRRAKGSEDAAATPVKGFAGAPGHPSVRPVSFKPETMPAAARIPWNPSFQSPVVSTVLSASTAVDDLFSFSAGLTQQPVVSGEFGTVRFNRVLVNDGGHYSPRTGIFTVPVGGRYLVSGLLTAQRGEHVEVVLSVSNRSVQRLQSSGGGAEGGCECGGSVSFSLILPLRRGDRVALIRTAGQLATTEAREVLSTFSAIFLYAPPHASR